MAMLLPVSWLYRGGGVIILSEANMLKRIALACAAALITGSTSALAAVCNSWDHTVSITNEDPNSECACMQQPEYNHTYTVTNWFCASDAQHQVNCGSWPCTDSSTRDEFSILCDPAWCGNYYRKWYGDPEHCSVCLYGS